MPFCPSCGTELIIKSKFCSQCGKSIETIPEVKVSKPQSWIYKFNIVFGVFMILIGAAFSNYFNVIMGIILFGIGFASLKNKSKTIDQLITIVTFIIVVIAIMNLLGTFD